MVKLAVYMPENPSHCSWFEDTHRTLLTSDGEEVRIINFNYQQDENLLREWALHLRRHYTSDEDLDNTSTAMGMSRAEYLRDIKFPNNTGLGPSVRSGDFSEIIVADYIEFLMNYFVPRTRYDSKPTPNTSVQGTDILGFKLVGEEYSNNDELITCEVKATLRRRKDTSFQEAIDDSKKDFNSRLPFALNATYQRLKERGDSGSLPLVERFMNKTGSIPYKHITGAFLVCSNNCWDDTLVTQAESNHPNSNKIFLVFSGVNLMDLANQLYEIAHVTA